MRVPLLPVVLAAGALCACEAPPGASPDISPAAARLPEPRLLETARFGSALAMAAPDQERLGGDRDALARRAAALRSRAAALTSPVMGPADRNRLTDGVSSPPAIPGAPDGSGEDQGTP